MGWEEVAIASHGDEGEDTTEQSLEAVDQGQAPIRESIVLHPRSGDPGLLQVEVLRYEGVAEEFRSDNGGNVRIEGRNQFEAGSMEMPPKL